MSTEIEELRGVEHEIPDNAFKLTTPTKGPYFFDDLFSLALANEGNLASDLAMDAMPLDAIFPITPMRQHEETLLINPKFSLDRTLFGNENFDNNEHLSNIEIVRRSQVPSSPLDPFPTNNGGAFFPLGNEDKPLDQDLLHAGNDISFSPLQETQMTPIKDLPFGSENEIATMAPVPSPLEATKILDSPDSVSEVVKILTFEESANLSKDFGSSMEKTDVRIRKRHKGLASSSLSKAAQGVPFGERKAHLLVNMDLTTELPSVTIQLQLKDVRDTLRSMESFVAGAFLSIQQPMSFLDKFPRLNADLINGSKVIADLETDPNDTSNNIPSKTIGLSESMDETTGQEPLPQVDMFHLDMTSENTNEDIPVHLVSSLHVEEPLEDILAANNNGLLSEMEPNGTLSRQMTEESPAIGTLNETFLCKMLEQALDDLVDEQPALSFNTTILKHCQTRREVSLRFYHILKLASLGSITVQQHEPHGDILILKRLTTLSIK